MAPIAVAVVFLVDVAVVGLLDRLGAGDRSGLRVVGKIVGHVVMGALAVTIGAWVAPSHRIAAAFTLWISALVVAVAAILSGELPLELILPLAAAFMLGASIGVALIRQLVTTPRAA